jgi:hypothetical protein
MTPKQRHRLVELGTAAITMALRCWASEVPKEEYEEIERALLDGTGSLAFVVRRDEKHVRVELARVAGPVASTPRVEDAILSDTWLLRDLMALTEAGPGEQIDARKLN